MKDEMKWEALNHKCNLLQDMGFTIEHQDSCVSLNGMEFDFSAITAYVPSIVANAIRQAYEQGVANGIESNQASIRKALGLEQD